MSYHAFPVVLTIFMEDSRVKTIVQVFLHPVFPYNRMLICLNIVLVEDLVLIFEIKFFFPGVVAKFLP
jgi:hypothetical protein